MTDFSSIIESLINCDDSALKSKVKAALDANIPAADILNKGLIPGMDIVGDKMESGDMFIPEVLMAAMSTGNCVAILKPLLGESAEAATTSVIIGTVKGDLHDIGKNLVRMMLESAGMEVHDLGVDIAPEDFVSGVKEKNAQFLCLSALLTTTMPMMRQTIDAVVESGLRDQVKILVRGAPVTQAFADEIGADGFAADAGSASRLVKTLAA